MKRTYSLSQQFIARFLVISLFLQSCSNLNNLPISVKKQATEERAASTKQLDIKHIVDKEFTAEGNHVVTFREEADQVVANVEMSVPAGFSKSYEGLATYIDQDINLTLLPRMGKEVQKRFIHFNPPKNGHAGSVNVYRPGLKGGGNVGTKDERKPEKNKGKERIQGETKGESREDLEPEEEEEESAEGSVSYVSSQSSIQTLPSVEKEECAEGESSPQVQYHTYAEALKALQANKPQAKVIDLSQEELNKSQFEVLKQTIDNNFVVGYAHWGQIPADCQELKEQIENKLINNICNYTYHPSDYVHGLLSKHVYSNPQQDQKVDLQVLSQELGHQPSSSLKTNWQVVQVKDDSKKTGYYSALYVNGTTHQAVLAFQGTKIKQVSELLRPESDLTEDIIGVLANNITDQQALAYEATKDAVDYIKQKGFNLSITGHSLGGYLAELGVVFCERDFNCRQVKGVVFDSPGTGKKLDTFKPNVKNLVTKFDTRGLPILTYLSAPNLVNACNWHPGEVYRVHPELRWPAWLERWTQRGSTLPVVGSGIGAINKGLLALTGHSLVGIINLFDPITGKPTACVRIADWPEIKTENLGYTSKGNGLAARFGILYHICAVVKDRNKINQSQYWEALEHLDEAYKQGKEEAVEEFRCKYAGHYRQSGLQSNEHILHRNKFKSIDWYLYKLNKQRAKLNQLKQDTIVSKVLKNILGDYEVVSISNEPYIKLKGGVEVESLRDRMQRALDVLSATSINQAVMGFKEMMHTFFKELETKAIKELPKLHSYIAQAKLKDYIARERKQEELSQKLEEEGICVVYGHGGVGKSTLVAEYGRKQEAQQAVWWIGAEAEDKLLTGYESLAQALLKEALEKYKLLIERLKQKPATYLTDLAREVYNMLEDSQQSCLLILDNADDPALIAKCLLHKPSSVQVIITTRHGIEFENYSSYNYGHPVKLEAFTDKEAKNYIQQSLEQSLCQPSEQDIQNLINEVTQIPQPLALAVAYIRNGNNLIEAVQEYIDELGGLKRQGKKRGEGELVLPEARLGIESLDAIPQQVMRYGAYLDPDFIPLSLISSLLKIDNRGALRNILAKLAGLSLITIIKGEGSEFGIQIHREVQAACKQHVDWKEGANLSQEALLLNILQALHEHMPAVHKMPDSSWEKGRLYATQVAHLLADAGEEAEAHPMLADLLDRMGEYNEKVQCNYQQILDYHQQALEMRQALYTGNHPDIANSLNNVGGVYKVLGQYQEALKYYEQALEMSQALYTGNHPKIAGSLNNLGDAYKDLGHPQEALKYYKQALEMSQALYTGNDPLIAISLNNVGSAYEALEQPQKALKYYRKALKIRQEVYIGNHPDIAESLNNVGGVYNILGQYQEALKYHQRALEMSQQIYTTGNHLTIAISLNNVGRTYYALGYPQEALKYLKQVLKIRQALYTGNHPFIAILLDNVGGVYEALGQYQEALKYYEQALEMSKALYTGNDLTIAISLNNIGNVYNSLGDHQEALEYHKQALEMRQALYQGNHPDIASSLNNLGLVYQALGQNQEALEYHKQALEMSKALYTDDHPIIRLIKRNIDQLKLDSGGANV